MTEETINPWTTVTRQTVYDNKWIKVEHADVITPTGTNGIYGTVHFKNIAIGIIPIDEDGNTWLVGQYRYALDEYSWEIPEGGCPSEMDMLDAAKRELAEEVGLAATHWQEIQRIHTSNSVCDEMAVIYLAKGLSPAFAPLDDTELLQIKKLPLKEAVQLVLNGQITDSLSVAGLLKTHWMMSEKKI